MQHRGPVDGVSGRAEARRGVMVFTQMDFNDTEREGKAAWCGGKCLETEQHLSTLPRILLWKVRGVLAFMCLHYSEFSPL